MDEVKLMNRTDTKFVLGVDNDEWCLLNGNENVELNKDIADSITAQVSQANKVRGELDKIAGKSKEISDRIKVVQLTLEPSAMAQAARFIIKNSLTTTAAKVSTD